MSEEGNSGNRRRRLGRRDFLGAAALGTGAALVGMGASAPATAQPAGSAPGQVDFPDDPRLFGGGGPLANNRAEIDLFDCEVEGHLPTDLNGVFYRVGPDPQYPKPPEYEHDNPFDGEGHVSMFRIRNGRVDYRTRYARNQRWKAQHAARRSLFGMYRNPTTDDPSVAGLSRGTANTQLFVHHKKLLVFKEDSPPVYMDPWTLDTLDDYYTFGGKLDSQTHTAHPKIDPVTGEFFGFGYEATGLLSKDIFVFSADRTGQVNWSATVQAPYAGMMHDFYVTQRHVIFYLINMVADEEIIRSGGAHFGYDETVPCYLGVMRRGGDGRDIKWFTGANLFCTHIMGGWSDGDKVTVDMDGAEALQPPFFPFFPIKRGRFDPAKSAGHIRRFTVDLSSRSNDRYQTETIFPEVSGALARQDDRFHTLPYRYGYLQGSGWWIVDHREKTARQATVPDYQLSESTFVPRSRNAPEGDGYLIGIGNSTQESGRSDLFLFDTQDIAAGPIARVRMPFKCVGQVHGFWADASDLPETPNA